MSKYFNEQTEKLDKGFENDKERDFWRQHDMYKYNSKSELRLCQKHKLSAEGKKHELVKRIADKLALSCPPELEKYHGDVHLIPSSITEISGMSVFQLREILRYHNVLDCGTKDELTVRVGMLVAGTVRLAFQREVDAIKNLITAIKALIHNEKRLYLVDPKVTHKRRTYSTSTSTTVSTSRPRDNASISYNQAKCSIPVPEDVTVENLQDALSFIESEIILYDRNTAEVNAEIQKCFQSRIKAVRSIGANVLAYWSKKEIGDTGWKSGKALYTPI